MLACLVFGVFASLHVNGEPSRRDDDGQANVTDAAVRKCMGTLNDVCLDRALCGEGRNGKIVVSGICGCLMADGR